jgi:protein involved in polysaccharide export with SLBB domain
VRWPGPIPVRQDSLNVAEVISSAGGLLPEAVSERVILRRFLADDAPRIGYLNPEKNYLDNITAQTARDMVVNLDEGPGPQVQPGDAIIVLRPGGFVEVSGQVRRPGFYDYHSGWKYGQYVNAAGGYGKNANKGKVRLSRAGFGEILFAQDVGEVAPGDVIWVPEREGPSTWRLIRDVAAITASALTVVVLFREVFKN